MTFSEGEGARTNSEERECQISSQFVAVLTRVDSGVLAMMRREKLAIAKIYVPVKRRATLKPDTVREIAESMLEVGQTTPILVRRDGERFVLVHGLHRLEACKALGEKTIFGYLVQAQKH
jgi:sulfiredoxin